MRNWIITGTIATIVIVLSIPLYVVKVTYLSGPAGLIAEEPAATFVGHEKCINCHTREYEAWQDSHHDHAMEPANEQTVLGDFDNAVFEHRGVTSRFYRNGGKYFVHTQGSNGEMADYEITYTFGFHPLQQYLVPFPGGRLQCLPISWDVEEKEWFHLYPNNTLDPKEWIYWTNAGQNWNGMCAECHSTNLKKQYDFGTATYNTTWSEIDVSCEACHGPGSRHVEWAELPEMARPPTDNTYELVVRTDNLDSRELVDLCAPCHSRRAILGDYTHIENELMDVLLPSLLTEELYFPDGQILDEVYVYSSFTQSKMYDRDVHCSDCHDVHSLKLVSEGNDLCLQCHRASVYDTKDHHFHKKRGEKGEPIRTADGRVLSEVGEGAECVTCHMPGRYYMVIDYRPDHSLRIPRPDLSSALGTPNACNECHKDKSNEWSAEYMTTWYGTKYSPHYGTILEAGRRGMPDAQEDLIRLSSDPLYPVIVRATALSILNRYGGEESARAFAQALWDEEPLIRRTAIEFLNVPDPRTWIGLIFPLLYDPVKSVRIEAASSLVGIPTEQLSEELQAVFLGALGEYEEAMEHSGDFASARHNLGNMFAALNKPEDAIENYKAAVEIDRDFYPAAMNLTVLLNRLGRNDEAEQLLRDVLSSQPGLHEAEYSLGLLLAEKGEYAGAAEYLEAAAGGMPSRARVYYNLGLILQHLERDEEAEAALLKTLEIEPDQMDYLNAVADFYIKRERYREAKRIAERMIATYPSHPLGQNLRDLVNRELKTRK